MRFICSIHASGYSLACSTSRTVGLTSRSTNARTVSTNMDSSSLSSDKCTAISRHIDTVLRPLTTSGAVTLYGQNDGGPHFDELTVGQVFDWAPSMTLTSGAAAVHQSILGDRMRLPLDAPLSHAVTGSTVALAHPALVCDVAIGQSTLVTQRVKANLFYRGLTFHRFPILGDTLYTRTEVVGLKQNSAKPGRPPTGLAALRMTTIDQADRLVLDFYRCAMLPLRPDAGETGHDDDLSAIGTGLPPAPDPTAGWDADVFRRRVPG